MKIVLDTNVIVSGLLSPYRAPAHIMRMIAANVLQVCFDSRIIIEYSDVLRRPHFNFDKDKIEIILYQIEKDGYLVTAFPLSFDLQDPDDAPFLEVAISGNVEYLITGNTKHFPKTGYQKLKIISPNEFLKVGVRHAMPLRN
jgi:putative PIN family toxin of toxin-antitoxin system